MWRPFRTASTIWTPRRSTCGVRSCYSSQSGRHLPNCMASVPAAFTNLDATQLGRWRPYCSASPIWTPYAQSHGVQFCCSSQVGRHPLSHMASAPSAFPNLDATKLGRWRPFCSASPFWTPYAQSHGVHSAQLPRFGRLSLSHMESIPAALPNLDASQLGRWRPFLLLFPIWTPPALTAGVHSAQLPRFGRLSLSHMASAPHNFPVLDATHSITRHPFCSASPIWTPYAQSHDVHVCCSSQVGRHSTRTLASILLSFPDLDAIRTITRRPILLLFSSWTPPTQSHGVHSPQLSQSGRLVSQHVASILYAYPDLDAIHTSHWRPIPTVSPIWTPYAQSHGVRSTRLSRFGRHPTRTLASVLHAYHVLDAIHPSHWRPLPAAFPVRTPLIQSHGVQFTRLSPFGRHATFRRHATSEFTLQGPRNSAK